MMDEALVPPASIEGMSAREIAPFKTEYDVVSALAGMGHDVRPIGVKTDLAVLGNAIDDFDPHICFNLVEDFDGIPWRDQHVVSYLELLNQPYTGCNPRGLTLARDKALTKKILAYHGVNVPWFAAFARGRGFRMPASLPFPLLVKSLAEEGSVGISQASIVHDERQLRERVAFLHESHRTDAIAEQYIEGRELYVGVMGNRKAQTLPIWELCLDKLPANAPRIATSKVKWDESYRQKHGIISRAASDLPESIANSIGELAIDIYGMLNLSGYARIDLRMTDDGDVFVIEANPNPQIARNEDFSDSALHAGVSYEALLQRILNLGLSYESLRLAA